MSRCTLDSVLSHSLRLRGFHPLWLAFPKQFCSLVWINSTVRTPKCTHLGLASFAFARRYLQNRFFFLFLRLLRCFSSPGSLPYTILFTYGYLGSPRWVPPFRHLRIFSYLHFPAAFRSLSRLSSALSAKASTLRSFLLDLHIVFWYASSSMHSVASFLWVSFGFSRMSWLFFIRYNLFLSFLYEVFKVHSFFLTVYQSLTTSILS